jgi:hypothetical protein
MAGSIADHQRVRGCDAKPVQRNLKDLRVRFLHDFNVPVRVSSDTGERTLFAWASAAVAVQIAELYHRTCG